MTEFEEMAVAAVRRLLEPLEKKIAEMEEDIAGLETVIKSVAATVLKEQGEATPVANYGRSEAWWQRQYPYPPTLEVPPAAAPAAVVGGSVISVLDCDVD